MNKKRKKPLRDAQFIDPEAPVYNNESPDVKVKVVGHGDDLALKHVYDRSLARSFNKRNLKNKPLIHPVDYDEASSGFNLVGSFEAPLYNFAEIIAVIHTEALVARAFGRQKILGLKHGFVFVGKNKKIVDYIKKRLQMICFRSNTTVYGLVNAMMTDIIQFSNHFSVLVRSAKHSEGAPYKLGGKTYQPIAGIFPVAINTLRFKKDIRGRMEKIKQGSLSNGLNRPRDRNKEFGLDEFIHFKTWASPGTNLGVPILVPVFDDIITLRRTEEKAEIQLHRHLNPLMSYQVGTENNPAREYPPSEMHPGGYNEVVDVSDKIAYLPSEGAIVHPERHKIELLSAKLNQLSPMEQLEYFKKRVLGGLMISGLDIGEGDTSNRSTSDTLSKTIIDLVKYYQQEIAEQFKHNIIMPLLRESTFFNSEDELMLEENQVELQFTEIDFDSLIKKENHFANIFSKNMITHDEARTKTGFDPLSDEDLEKTQYHLFPKTKQDNAVENNDMPTNQHGTKMAPTTRTSSMILDSFSNPVSNPSGTLSSTWFDLVNHPQLHSFGKQRMKSFVKIAMDAAIHQYSNQLQSSFAQGIVDVLNESEDVSFDFQIDYDFRVDEGKRVVTKLVDNLINGLFTAYDKLDANIRDLMMNKFSRIKMIDTNESARMYNYGRAVAYAKLGFSNLKLQNLNESPCEPCKDSAKNYKLNLRFLDYSMMPPHSHPNANQKVIGIK